MALFEPSCAEAYADVFSDDSDADFCVLGYEGRKLACVAKGSGGLEQLVTHFDDAKVMYALLRQIKMDDGGDSRRVKFAMITWVGESAPAMKKGAVTSHKPAVGELFKGHHVSRSVMERDELATLAIDIAEDILKAGGANYDLGNIRSGVSAGATGSIKAKSAEFFRRKDAETEIKDIKFAEHIRKGKEISACDLGGRPMVAAASAARSNTVGYSATGGPSIAEVSQAPTADAAQHAAASKEVKAPTEAAVVELVSS